jgi:GDP-L-fucose synthase
MCQSYNQQYGTHFISVMPTNLYGPHDNFDLKNSHVLPAMLRKFHETKENGHTPVELWDSGTPRREFVYSEDMADACLYVMKKLNAGDAPGDLYNIGSGSDLTIKELALKIQATVGHHGDIHWDTSQPYGTLRKWQDISRLSELGWYAKTDLNEGLQLAYDWFCQNNQD